LEGLLRLSKA
jgi:hypothetical protein